MVCETARRIADSLLAVTVAPRCAACAGLLDEPSGGPVCGACWAMVDPLPRFLGDVATVHLAGWRAAGDYEGSLRQIIHAFKYDDRRSLARPLGRRMFEAGRDILDGAFAVVPVPLHPWRRFRRGFNQAALLAARLGLPVVHGLWRIQWTTPQAGLPRDGRWRNVESAFRLSPLLSRTRRQQLIAGRTLVLVDDVRTTGATLEACAKVLRDAGAREVRGITAAGVRGGQR